MALSWGRGRIAGSCHLLPPHPPPSSAPLHPPSIRRHPRGPVRGGGPPPSEPHPPISCRPRPLSSPSATAAVRLPPALSAAAAAPVLRHSRPPPPSSAAAPIRIRRDHGVTRGASARRVTSRCQYGGGAAATGAAAAADAAPAAPGSLRSCRRCRSTQCDCFASAHRGGGSGGGD